MFNDTKYTIWYFRIIVNAKKLNRVKIQSGPYFERHHIVPRSLGGTNANENLVLLSAKEHYICHLLLTKMCIDSTHAVSMNRAWWIMCKKNRKTTSSRLFEQRRISYSEAAKSARLGQKHTDETKRKISANHADVSGNKNPNYGNKVSCETKRKIVQNRRSYVGKNNPNFGKSMKDETRARLSTIGQQKWTPEMRNRLKQARSIGEIHTPWGVFVTLKDAAQSPNALYKDPTTIKRKCVDQLPGFNIIS